VQRQHDAIRRGLPHRRDQQRQRQQHSVKILPDNEISRHIVSHHGSHLEIDDPPDDECQRDADGRPRFDVTYLPQ